MHYKIKELHRLITNLKNEEGLSDYGVTLLEGYAVGLETVVKNCSIPAVSNQRELLIAYNKHILDGIDSAKERIELQRKGSKNARN